MFDKISTRPGTYAIALVALDLALRSEALDAGPEVQIRSAIGLAVGTTVYATRGQSPAGPESRSGEAGRGGPTGRRGDAVQGRDDGTESRVTASPLRAFLPPLTTDHWQPATTLHSSHIPARRASARDRATVRCLRPGSRDRVVSRGLSLRSPSVRGRSGQLV